jgi:hypothetical protein
VVVLLLLGFEGEFLVLVVVWGVGAFCDAFGVKEDAGARTTPTKTAMYTAPIPRSKSAPTPRLRSTVESVRSRCQREIGSLFIKWSITALASPRLPSEFSKSIGLTLCGIVLLPTSPATVRCLK